MNRRAFLNCAALLPFAACAHKPLRVPGSDPRLREIIGEFESQLPKLMAEFNVPGLSIAVVTNAKIAWRRGFGFENASARTRVDNETIFRACGRERSRCVLHVSYGPLTVVEIATVP